jgi:ABC-type transport system involved in multi-copper enzyme maturation permease subunit
MTTTYPLTASRSTGATFITRTAAAEWTKLRTLRSTWRSIGAATTLAIGLGAAIVAAQVAQWNTMTATQHKDFDATATSLIGLLFAAVILGALGVRSVTAEYNTGMIRTTFTARPARRAVLAAKAVTVAALAFPVALVTNLVGFEIGQRILTAKHVQVSLTHPGALRAIILGGVAVSLVTVLGVGLGGLIRRTAPATTGLSLLLIGGVLFGQFLPAGFRQYLPSAATQAVVTVHRSAGLLRPGPALAVLTGYAAIALGAAAIRIGRRDA